MKFFQTVLTMIAYCIGLAYGISYVVRIGGPRTPPILPGQVWQLPGLGNVTIVHVEGSYVYYESFNDDQTWCCRMRIFREHAKLIAGHIKPAPVMHLIDPETSNVIKLNKDKSNDSV